MRIPRTVKVGPHVYRILRKTKSQMKNDLGLCFFDSVEIWLLQGMDPSKTREVLAHEVLHACTYPSLCGGEKCTDEVFVEVTAVTLLNVLRENPKLVAYLTHDQPRT